jgi:DNA-binding transcriptional MerR regulator
MNAYTIKDFTDELKKRGYSITRNQLRHYEREGLVAPQRQKRGQSEYRYYVEDDINRVIMITNLISLSWTSKEVSGLIKLVEEMEKVFFHLTMTKNALTDLLQGKKIENSAVIEELALWKQYKPDVSNKILPKIITTYASIQLVKNHVERNTMKMLEKAKYAVEILERYQNRIKENEADIVKLTEEIVGLANKEGLNKKG